MAVRGARRGIGAARLDDGDGLARSARPLGGARKSFGILDAFEVQTECRHARIVAENFDQVLDRQTRLIAHGEQAADGQGAMIEHEREGNRAALANERDAALDGRSHDLIGHHGDPVEEIDEAVAIGSEEGQGAGIAGQIIRECNAGFGAGLREAGAEADESSGAARGQRAGDARAPRDWAPRGMPHRERPGRSATER